MHDDSSPTRGFAWIGLAVLLGGLLLPVVTFVGLTRFADVSAASAATITVAVGFGFAWLLSLALAVVGWDHAAGKVTAVGGMILGVSAAVVAWQQFSQPASELDGTWQGIQWEGEDGKRADAGATAMRMTIAGDKLKMTHPLGPIDGFIFTDATQNPKTFHLGGDIGGEGRDVPGLTASGDVTITGAHIRGDNLNWVGIYKLEGDTLTLCMGTGQAAERPKELKSNPAAMLVLRRVKQ